MAGCAATLFPLWATRTIIKISSDLHVTLDTQTSRAPGSTGYKHECWGRRHSELQRCIRRSQPGGLGMGYGGSRPKL